MYVHLSPHTWLWPLLQRVCYSDIWYRLRIVIQRHGYLHVKQKKNTWTSEVCGIPCFSCESTVEGAKHVQGSCSHRLDVGLSLICSCSPRVHTARTGWWNIKGRTGFSPRWMLAYLYIPAHTATTEAVRREEQEHGFYISKFYQQNAVGQLARMCMANGVFVCLFHCC